MKVSHPTLCSTKTLYHLHISDPFWQCKKMLTVLFKLVWNTQKSTWTSFFEYQGKMFLYIEKVLVKISEEQPKMHCLIVFIHILEIDVSNFY